MILRTFTRSLFRARRTHQLRSVDIAVCIDIECTCDSPLQIQPMELIEIACLKLDLTKIASSNQRSYDFVDECPTFHSFVKPVINSELTLFCKELTGLTQSIVDRAEPVEHVTDKLFSWLVEEELIDANLKQESNFAFASCGNFDLNLLSPVIRRCKFNNDLELPIYFQEWINVKKTFVNHKREWPKSLYHMLELLSIKPSGRLHSAKDDCKNLARIVECLYAGGCDLNVTNRSSHHHYNDVDNSANKI